jgi:transposase
MPAAVHIVDFGEAIGVIGGVERKIHFFAFDLPHSDACFVVGYPADTTEAFCDGHVRAFAFFGGVPQSILYDNLWTPPAQGDLFGVGGGSIRPVAGAIAPLALMGVRSFWPLNTIGHGALS